MKTPTEDQIRRRAYEIYMKHGESGRDTQNWLQAERELRQMPEHDEKEASNGERKSTGRRGNGKKFAAVVSGSNQ